MNQRVWPRLFSIAGNSVAIQLQPPVTYFVHMKGKSHSSGQADGARYSLILKSPAQREFSQTKPFCRPDETFRKHRPYIRVPVTARERYPRGGLPMFELTIAFFAAFSASMFLAHGVEAYLAR